MSQAKRERKPRRAPPAFLVAVATALVIAIATAIGTGLGQRVLDLFKSDPALVSSSAAESIQECGTDIFVPEPTAGRLRTRAVPRGDWLTSFLRRPGAGVAGQSLVEVSIQGESSRTITLTGIDVEVQRRPRSPGAVFSAPCGDSVHGRSVLVDLDRRPAAIVDSTIAPHGELGTLDRPAQSASLPIRFPWTVSITDPLLLQIVAASRQCLCTWRAYVTWRSGAKSGRIEVDNGGKGYTVVGDSGVGHYTGAERWVRYSPGGPAD